MKLKRLFKILAYGIFFVFIFIFISNLVVQLGAKSYIYESVKNVPKVEVALIPGAAVLSNGQISSIFKDRVDRAIELYKAEKVSKILVSGDNSTVAHNEVNPVRNYLLGKGIPDADIFLDHAGFDTYSTMYRARDIFQVSSMIISTQSFHLPRAVFIARELSIKAYGISADGGNILFKNYFREFFADGKAILSLLFKSRPKYLGQAIPITSDSREY